MISYPSSFKSSRVSDKENVNPNNKTKATGSSPTKRQKIVNMQSNKSDEFPSVYNTIKQNKNEVSHNSMKTFIHGFCSTIQETQQSTDESFFKLVKMFYCREDLSIMQAIQICQRDHIFDKEDILAKIEGKRKENNCNIRWKQRNVLVSDLGSLMVQEICNCLTNGKQLDNNQIKILQLLVPINCQSQITPGIVFQHYDIYKQQKSAQKSEMNSLAAQFRNIRKQKIEPKLWSDHFRLEIGKSLNYQSQNERMSFNQVNRCFKNLLNSNQISIIFKYIYGLETGSLMPILDTSKTISIKLARANFLRKDENQIYSVEFHRRNMCYYLESNYNKIKTLQEERSKHIKVIEQKDTEIDRLNKIIDIMSIESEQTERLRNHQMNVQLQAHRNNYEKRIQELIEKNKSQAKMTEWYRRQLEIIVKENNKQNIIRKYLGQNL